MKPDSRFQKLESKGPMKVSLTEVALVRDAGDGHERCVTRCTVSETLENLAH